MDFWGDTNIQSMADDIVIHGNREIRLVVGEVDEYSFRHFDLDVEQVEISIMPLEI